MDAAHPDLQPRPGLGDDPLERPQAELSTRPRRMPRSERRTQLLETARGVFTTHGYHAAAMEDIAERAGVSKPVLYQHFASKLDLYVALLEASAREIVAGVTGALDVHKSKPPTVTEAVGRYLDFVSDSDGAFRLVFDSDLLHDPRVREIIDATTTRCAEAIAPLIQNDTDLTDEEARMLGAATAATAQAAAQYWVTEQAQAQAQGRPPAMSRERAVALIAELIWNGAGSGFRIA